MYFHKWKSDEITNMPNNTTVSKVGGSLAFYDIKQMTDELPLN